MFKFAEAQSAVTFVLGSTVHGQSKYGGKQLYYTPHGSSLGKNFLQRNQAPKRKDVYVAARALAAGLAQFVQVLLFYSKRQLICTTGCNQVSCLKVWFGWYGPSLWRSFHQVLWATEPAFTA